MRSPSAGSLALVSWNIIFPANARRFRAGVDYRRGAADYCRIVCRRGGPALFTFLQVDPKTMADPRTVFHSDLYLAHNDARLTHLARLLGSMELNPKGKRVLEVGAGIGDHTEFWLRRGADITVTDARDENVALVKQRFENIRALTLDLDQPDKDAVEPHEIVYAFGVLYHLSKPQEALAFLADKCEGVLFLETCVSRGDDLAVNLTEEPSENPSQAVGGMGCRPTRPWIFQELKKHFPYVYQPSYQPDHPEFPTDWRPETKQEARHTRTTFVASRTPVSAATFFPRVLDKQTRQAKRTAPVKPGLEGLLSRTGFGLVLDVGANQGQFAARLRALGYDGPIASFEPLSSAFARLKALAGRDPNLSIFNFALGAKAETREIFISGNSASSSFLPIEDMTVAAEPLTAVVGREAVEIRRLDDVAADAFSQAKEGPALLKLDTQGTEREVLEGAKSTLEKIDYILTECSLVSVYKGEPLIESQIEWMRKHGFDPVSIDLGWSDPQTGRTYQVDVLFKRR